MHNKVHYNKVCQNHSSNLENSYLIKKQLINLGNITIGDDGYLDIRTFIPEDIISKILFVTIDNFGDALKKYTPVCFGCSNYYIISESNVTIRDLRINVFYA